MVHEFMEPHVFGPKDLSMQEIVCIDCKQPFHQGQWYIERIKHLQHDRVDVQVICVNCAGGGTRQMLAGWAPICGMIKGYEQDTGLFIFCGNQDVREMPYMNGSLWVCQTHAEGRV